MSQRIPHLIQCASVRMLYCQQPNTSCDHTCTDYTNTLCKDTGEETVDGRQGSNGLCLFDYKFLHKSILVIGDISETTRVVSFNNIVVLLYTAWDLQFSQSFSHCKSFYCTYTNIFFYAYMTKPT